MVDHLCTSCGTCVRVCHQKAKTFQNSVADLWFVLASDRPTVAMLAPSFTASFTDVQPEQVIAGLRHLGFDRVMEVAYGAELSARAYHDFLKAKSDDQTEIEDRWPEVVPPYISSPCPAIVNLIEIHYPDLVKHLVPIVSPMVALGRYLRKEAERRDERSPYIVFIGPCVAKKSEVSAPGVSDAVDLAISFSELRHMLKEAGVKKLGDLAPSEMDPPHASLARVFPLAGGLLRSAAVQVDLLNDEILIAEGRDDVLDILQSLQEGNVRSKFIDLLFCEGCIDGPLIDTDLPLVERRDRVVKYTLSNSEEEHLSRTMPPDLALPEEALDREFIQRGQDLANPSEEQIREILKCVGKYTPEDELNCGACGYATCRAKAIAVYRNLAETEMCLPYMIDKLEDTVEQLEGSYDKLRDTYDKLQETQQELVQAEKLSSLGQLSAGVAHELNNPLGGILLYADMIREGEDPEEVGENVGVIRREAARCREIVQGLLNFARQSRLQKREVSFNAFVREVIEDCRRRIPEGFGLVTDFDENADCRLELDPSQMRRVLTNLLDNAIDAMDGSGEISVSTYYNRDSDDVIVKVTDEGAGISEDHMSQVFTPFFTTKEPGKGTGLGLPIAYGIVKMHRGQIEISSELGEGTEAKVTLPRESGPPADESLLGADRRRDSTVDGEIGAGQGPFL